jgi:hypothetical protein
MDWAFDCKDSSKDQDKLDEKFGNFNTPILLKLCSKYNKGATKKV